MVFLGFFLEFFSKKVRKTLILPRKKVVFLGFLRFVDVAPPECRPPTGRRLLTLHDGCGRGSSWDGKRKEGCLERGLFCFWQGSRTFLGCLKCFYRSFQDFSRSFGGIPLSQRILHVFLLCFLATILKSLSRCFVLFFHRFSVLFHQFPTFFHTIMVLQAPKQTWLLRRFVSSWWSQDFTQLGVVVRAEQEGL